MLQRRSNLARHPRHQTEHCLASLAWQLRKHSQAVFYLERLQTD
jgi:hypothetical protein